MMAMEISTLPVQSPAGPASLEKEKPRAPRFEAYVMTGDAILNLSRTTHSPEFLPIHSRRKKIPLQTSNSVPNSPCELIHNGTKPWEQENVSYSPNTPNTAVSCVRSSRSEDGLYASTEAEIEIKNQAEDDLGFSYNTLLEPGKDNERIVWTYNAPMSEQEMRRLEAEQFWLFKQQPSLKPLNQLTSINENVEINPGKPVKNENEGSVNADTVESVNVNLNGDDVHPTKSEDIVENGSGKTSAKGEENESKVGSSGVEDNCEKLPPSTGSFDEDSDGDSLQSFHYSPKGVDMPSAVRLAKRLYTLDGFHKSDVSRHLCKNNDFSRVVAEEYLKHFDFENTSLDMALRRFLLAFQLTGESSERDRVLVHFSHRYLQCNPDSFSSQDGVHILTCALLLLNSDLHGKHQGMKRMTCAQFIKRLAGLNDGGNFSVELLRRLYNAIKEHPLEWASDSLECAADGDLEPAEIITTPKEIPSNPYLDIPSPVQSQEFKKGYIMRKCCMEPNGKRTALGKRGWRMYFAVLKDLILYLYKDEATCKGELPPKSSSSSSRKKPTVEKDPGPAALIRVHHALATNAPDYTKKQNVFRLFTADRAQFLIQTSDTKELRCWMDAINTAASLLSAPPLPAPVGSQQRFQRPLLPASLTKLPPRDQLLDHEERVQRLEHELREHRACALPPNAKTALANVYREKDAYLHYEKTRYEAYCAVLRAAFGTTLNHDLSLLELDERCESGKNSPDLKANDAEARADS